MSGGEKPSYGFFFGNTVSRKLVGGDPHLGFLGNTFSRNFGGKEPLYGDFGGTLTPVLALQLTY